jgi:uncharacterized protein (TIGR00725 family)
VVDASEPAASRGAGRPPLIAVCGAADATDDNVRDARDVGRLLAERGAVVVCGGFEGVMCAAAEGAREGGGVSFGLLAGDDADEAAVDVTYALPLGLGELANAVLPRVGVGMVAIGAGFGTLSEVAHAIKLGRPVAALSSWAIDPPDGGRDRLDGFYRATTPEEAVDWLLGRVRR